MARKLRMSVWGAELSPSLWRDLQSEQGAVRIRAFTEYLDKHAHDAAARVFFKQGVSLPAEAKVLAREAFVRLSEVLALRVLRHPQDLRTELVAIVETIMKEQRHLTVQVNQAGEETRG